MYYASPPQNNTKKAVLAFLHGNLEVRIREIRQIWINNRKKLKNIVNMEVD